MLKILRKPRTKAPVVGPNDHGRSMSLDAFDHAVAVEGHLYELNKGVIEVSDVPKPSHLLQVQEIREQLTRYRFEHPDTIMVIAAGNEAKILLASDQSERHPDLLVYLSSPPDVKDVWSIWVPAIVVEIVSESSIKRDYEDKPPEYLGFGIDEYWIVDAMKQQMTALTRWRGQWKEKIVKPSQKYATSHLPGFSLDLKRVFAAAK